MEMVYMKKMVFSFGRFNPPTTGHLLLATRVKEEARRRGADYVIYGSSTTDRKKNPLSSVDKLRYMKKILKGFNVVVDKNYNTPFIVLKQLSDAGYDEVTMVVGSDRVNEFRKSVGRYVGPKKEFKFSKFEVISAGERDPDADDVSGMSASKMRAAAVEGNISIFRLGIPSHISDKDVMGLFKAVRRGMGVRGNIKESWFNYNEFEEFAANILQLNESEELQELTVRARRKMAKIARRTAKKRARKRKIKEKKMKGKKELTKKANKTAMLQVRNKLIRGMKWNELSFMQREKIDDRIKKKKKIISKIAKRMMPNMQKAERERLKKVRNRMTATTPAKAIAPANESIDSIFENFLIEARDETKQRLNDKENNRGVGTENPKQRDAARKRAERKTETTGNKPSWKDLVLVRPSEGRNKGKIMLVLKSDIKNDMSGTDYKIEDPRPSRGSAGSAAQGDDWFWTKTAKKMMKQTEDKPTKRKGKEESPTSPKGDGEEAQTPEQKQATKIQTDMSKIDLRQKELEIQDAEKEAEIKDQEDQEQAEYESRAYDPTKRPWEQKQIVLSPRKPSELAAEYDNLESLINTDVVAKSNEGKQFEYALTVASDLSRGMTVDDIVRKNEANGGKNLTFGKSMFAIAIMTLGQLEPEDRDRIYHWDELGISTPGGEPKTDNVILNPDGSIKHKISLKNDKTFQLSSEQGQGTANALRTSLESAMQHTPNIDTKKFDQIIEQFEQLPTKMVASKTADRVRKNPKNAYMFTSSGKIKPEYNYDKFRDSIQKQLTEEVTKALTDNDAVRLAMVHECMTGKNKFDKMGVPEAAADAMLSPYGFELIGDDPYIDETIAKYADGATIRVRGKSRKGIYSSVGSSDVKKPTIIANKSKKLTGYGKGLLKDRIKAGDEYATSAGRMLGFNEMFSIIREAENDDDLLIDTTEIKQQIVENPYGFAAQTFVDTHHIDININNPNIDDSNEFNTIVINGKEKQLPVTNGNHILRQIVQDEESDLDESFEIFMNKNEDYLMMLPDYPIQRPQYDTDLFDKTLGREFGWEIGDPAKPLDLHGLPTKKKKNKTINESNHADKYRFADSSLQGVGSFANRDINEGSVLDLYLLNLMEDTPTFQRTDLCRLTNHSHINSNVQMKSVDNNFYIFATRDINEGEELLIDYFDVFGFIGNDVKIIQEVLNWTDGYDDLVFSPDTAKSLVEELKLFIEIGDCPKIYEEHGAGEIGTEKLLKRYIKDTPFMTLPIIKKDK
jgi:nicotinic acid mononucleotide adenylyltransferase